MHNISRSVVKKDHAPKMEGRSVYVCDIDKHGILCGKMLRSKYARAKLLSVKVPELPDGYFYVDKNDVPGDNNVNIVMDDTPVYARETVEYIGENDDHGLYLQIDHGNGVKSFYAHCSKLCVSQGQTVAAGETVALVGSTGVSTGPHLHLEIKCNGVHVDPAYYVTFLTD